MDHFEPYQVFPFRPLGQQIIQFSIIFLHMSMSALNIRQDSRRSHELVGFATWRFHLQSAIGSKLSELAPPIKSSPHFRVEMFP